MEEETSLPIVIKFPRIPTIMPFGNSKDLKKFLSPSFICVECGQGFVDGDKFTAHTGGHKKVSETPRLRPEKQMKPIKELENMLKDTIK